jgi:tetratricopeptide (TPR) repeat protein
MPLGLELAASWTRLLTCEEIAQQIEHSLDFLVSSTRDAPERHRSLRAAFDHSWRLLSADEQRILRRLSVFCGGFRREATEHVTGATLPLLSSLADKSLLRRSESGRYEVHELIRQHAASHLQGDPAEQAAICRRHGEYYLALLQQCEPALGDRRQAETVAALTPDIDNLRLAWAWAMAHLDLDLLRGAARPLWRYYSARSLFDEGEALFRQAADRVRTLAQTADIAGDVLERLLGRLQLHQAAFGYRVGRIVEAKALLRSSIELLRRHDDQAAVVDAMWFLANACWMSGELEDGSRYAQEGYALACNLPNSPWLVEGMFHAGMVAHNLGDYAEAYRRLSEALDLSRATGHLGTTTVAASLLCRTSCQLGKFTEMEQILSEILQAATATDDRFCQGMALEQLGQIARARGDIQEARRLCEQSIALYRQISDLWGLSRALTLSGKVVLAAGDSTEARRRFTDAFTSAVGAQVYPIALDALAGLAMVCPQAEQALAMTLAILQHPSATKGAKRRAERLRVALEARLKAEQIEAVQAQAPTKSLEAIAQTLLVQASDSVTSHTKQTQVN